METVVNPENRRTEPETPKKPSASDLGRNTGKGRRTAAKTAMASDPETPDGNVGADASSPNTALLTTNETGPLDSDYDHEETISQRNKDSDNNDNNDDAAESKPTIRKRKTSGKAPLPPKAPKLDYVDWKIDCPPALRQFLLYLGTIKGRSPRTVSAYYVDLRSFLRYLKLTHGLADGKEFLEIPIADTPQELLAGVTMYELLEYLSYMMEVRSNSSNTRARKVSSLHTFYKYLESQRIVPENPVKDLSLPSVPKTLPKYLTLEESRSLLNVSEGEQKERDHCIFTLFLNCGMRLSELVGINLSDIRDNAIQITGKGNKQRIAYLNASCQEALKQYLPVRAAIQGAKDSQALFLSSGRKQRITARGVQVVFDRYLELLGLKGKGYTVHKLRHTAATLMYRYGHVDIRVLQMILGHENLGTTEIYTHVANQQMEDAVNASPLANDIGIHSQQADEMGSLNNHADTSEKAALKSGSEQSIDNHVE